MAHTPPTNPSSPQHLLFKACLESDAKTIRSLFQGIEAHKALRARDPEGETALHLATRSGDLKCLSLLLQLGARVDIQNRKGRTSLYNAIEMGNLEQLQLLLKSGANVNWRDSNGTTPFMVSSARSYKITEIQQCLIDAAAILNAQDRDGWTALHYAIHFRRHQNVPFLVDAGVNPELKNRTNQWPEQISPECPLDTVRYLQQIREAAILRRTIPDLAVAPSRSRL